MTDHTPDNPTPGEAAPDAKVIKRYSNRKLYDTVESKYVTLEEIAVMVKNGMEVKIIDNRNKEDITTVTLAQIIFEEEKKTNRMPLKVLKEIIRHPGESLSEFIESTVSPKVASLKEEAESRIDKLLGRETHSNESLTAADVLKNSQKLFEDWQRKVDERVKVVVENVVGSLPALGRDLQALTQKMDDLEKKIEQLEKSDRS